MGTRLWQLLSCVWKDGIIDCYGYGVGAHEGLSKHARACLHMCVSVCLRFSVTIQQGQDQLVVPRGKGVDRADLAPFSLHSRVACTNLVPGPGLRSMGCS